MRRTTGESPADQAAPAGSGGDVLPLLRAAEDAAVEPWALLHVVRGPDRKIVDFVYRAINPVAARQQGCRPEELLDRSLAETMPRVVSSGLLAMYAHCVDTGEPLILDDFSYYGRTPDSPSPDTHRYDVRAVRVEDDYLSVTWRDVNRRYEAELAAEEARRRQAEADALYRRLMDHSVVPTSLNSAQGGFLAVNQAMCDFFGDDAQTLMSKTWQDLTAPEELDRDVAAVGEILAGQRDSYRVTKQYVHADGHRLWGDLSLSAIRTPGGEVENIICQIVDVTEQVGANRELEQARRRLFESEEHFRLLVDNSTDVVAVTRDDTTVTWVSPSVEQSLGAPPQHWLGRPATGFVHPDDVPRARDGSAYGLLVKARRRSTRGRPLSPPRCGWRWRLGHPGQHVLRLAPPLVRAVFRGLLTAFANEGERVPHSIRRSRGPTLTEKHALTGKHAVPALAQGNSPRNIPFGRPLGHPAWRAVIECVRRLRCALTVCSRVAGQITTTWPSRSPRR